MSALRAAALLALLGAASLPRPALAGPFSGNHPRVKQGTEAYDRGDYEKALQSYEEAAKEVERSPELLFDLGDAYMKLDRPEDARRAFEAALSGADDSLKSRAYYNLGNALARLGQKDDAVTAYRQALKVDPRFEPARHNLEVMLRKKSDKERPGNPAPGDGGTPDGGSPDGGAQDGGSQDGGKKNENPDAGEGDAGQSGDDGGADASEQGDSGTDPGDAGSGADGGGGGDGGAKEDGGEARDGGDSSDENEQSDQPDGGVADAGQQDGGSSTPQPLEQPQPKEIDRQKAEELLDRLRDNEKQFLMWQQQKGKQRAHPEKDW